MRDILLIMGHLFHIRNYVSSGLVKLLLQRGLKVSAIIPGNVFTIIENDKNEKICGDQMHRLEDVSAFGFRRMLLEWVRLGSMVSRRNLPEYRWKIRRAAWSRVDRGVALAFWSAVESIYGAETVAYSLFRKIRVRSEVYKLLQENRPRLVVWPTIVGNLDDIGIVKAASDLGIPIMMGEGSWDNMTSKGAIWPRPNRVLVWGEYSRKQALVEHKFRDAEVIVTGPPHFDVYSKPEALVSKQQWLKQHNLNPTKRLILIGGTTVGKFSEEAYVLRLVSGWIDSGVLPPSYIWYRPHPRARSRVEKEAIGSIRHIVLDPGVSGEDGKTRETWSLHPDDAIQRANALAACDIIVSAFSTIVIEGALLGKPSVLVGFARSNGHTPPTIYPSLEFRHVQYLLQCPWIKATYCEDELLSFLREFLQVDPGSIYRELREFGLTVAQCGDGKAKRRIIEAIETMLKEVGSPNKS